jgi:hypothetical protein
MSEAVAPAPAAPAPSSPRPRDNNAGTLTDRIVSGIGDDFDLGTNYEEPSRGGLTEIEPGDFDEDDDADDGDAEDTKREKPAPKPKPKDEPSKPKAVAPAPAKGEPEAPPEPKVKSPLPLDRGTEDKPYGVNDLPADKFVKLKIDGQETTLPMRELADGYIRKQTFDVNLSKAKQSIQDAERIARGHLEERTKLRGDLDAFLGDENRVFKTLIERDPDMLLRLGALIGTQYGEWTKDPGARQRYDFERQQRQLAEERKRVESERRAWEAKRSQTEATEAARRNWEGPFKEAMKEAGFPKITPEFQDTVRALMAQAQKRGQGKVDVATFKAIVLRAAKLVGAETVDQRQPPSPSAPEPREPMQRTPRGEKKWDGMTHNQKFRDNDWILRKLK